MQGKSVGFQQFENSPLDDNNLNIPYDAYTDNPEPSSVLQNIPETLLSQPEQVEYGQQQQQLYH